MLGVVVVHGEAVVRAVRRARRRVGECMVQSGFGTNCTLLLRRAWC